MSDRYDSRAWRGYAPLRRLDAAEVAKVREMGWDRPFPWRPGSNLSVPSDTEPAAWIAPRLDAGSFLVQMMVPFGFEACARLFFPFDVDGFEVSWTEVAQRYKRIPHPLMEEETVSTPPGGTATWDVAVSEPSAGQIGRLLDLLPAHTASKEFWYLLWEGWGGLDEQAFRGQPPVEHDMRSYHLLHGPLEGFEMFSNLPSYWWPEDRSWVWCADTDFKWAYLAGSATLIDELVSDAVLDAYRTELSNPAHSGMDTINDPRGDIQRH